MTAPEAIVKAISAYLKTNMNLLTKVTDEWPNANQKLELPCITVLIGEPDFTQGQNYLTYKGTPNTETNQVLVRQCKGTYDFRMKCHLWADSKPQRHKIYDQFLLAMNPQKDVSGLRLQLTSYFNEWATFDIAKHVVMDNEESVQRSERRIVIDILVNVRAIFEKTEYFMKTIENDFDTPSTIVSDGSSSGTII